MQVVHHVQGRYTLGVGQISNGVGRHSAYFYSIRLPNIDPLHALKEEIEHGYCLLA